MSLNDESNFLLDPIEVNTNTDNNINEEPINEEPINEEPINEEPVKEEQIKEINNVVEPEVEKVEEIIVAVELNTTEKSLTTIILSIIKNYYEKNLEMINYFNKIGIYVSKDTIDLTQKIIDTTPSILNDIENAFIEVTKDNKIDTNDIPQFILILQILYERIFNQKDSQLNPIKRSEYCANILKFTLHILVEERKIIQDEVKNDFLEQLDKLIDSCVNLFSFSNILEQPKICCTIM
jgi:hypothetical protein